MDGQNSEWTSNIAFFCGSIYYILRDQSRMFHKHRRSARKGLHNGTGGDDSRMYHLGCYVVIWLLSSSSVVSVQSSSSPPRHFIDEKSYQSKRQRNRVTWLNSLIRRSHYHVQVPSPYHFVLIVNGGATDDWDSDDEYDVDVDEDDDTDEDDEQEKEEVYSTAETAIISTVNSIDNIVAYDEPLMPSPYINMLASVFVMLIGRKYDLFHPTLVRAARFCFIGYLVCLQLFLIYTRIKAKIINDRTSIEVSNPLSSMLQTQLLGGNSNDSSTSSDSGTSNMIKSLASSFLSSKSTVCEYDLKQARSMQSGLIFNMLFMWFLHFKMNQVQPLIIQSITGFTSMIYSPLFQVYVMNRNLERPFKTVTSSTASEQNAEGEDVEEGEAETMLPEKTADESEDSAVSVEEDLDSEDADENVEETTDDDDEEPETVDDD
jgi:Phosphate transport (Pho88)